MSLPKDLSVLGVEVPIGSLEKELKKLWEADDARTNASLINFAIYSENGSDLVRNSEIAGEITREHACRAILIGIDTYCEETGIRAWITAHCHLAGGRKSVCSEQLAFHLTGRAVGRFRNTVFAHLNSDLPLVFWWQGELSGRFNERLYGLINRLVVDSSEWGDLAGQFDLVDGAMRDSGLVVQDLSWTRIYHYRLAVAGVFDEPVALAGLESVRQVKVKVHPKHRVSGLQLLAWLAVQAGWELSCDLIADGGADSFRFAKKGGDLVDACVVQDEESAPVGALEICGPEVEVHIQREPGATLLRQRLTVGGVALVDRSSPADADGAGELVADQLSRGGKNSLFKKVMPTFLKLLK